VGQIFNRRQAQRIRQRQGWYWEFVFAIEVQRGAARLVTMIFRLKPVTSSSDTVGAA